ncbi:hypothetical protein PFISCL1PPCAC_9864 [Pristionchus fissidentatus]|uniref:Uncharacterized protein n=1 Tax=Pristionchus fissidentatus TaxID=1538716 RepID=A0AAV5VKF6_9BILA|nr:hypothetical protein PFISCL1PPCAC_9864 [Pristionchus fissidentatus]
MKFNDIYITTTYSVWICVLIYHTSNLDSYILSGFEFRLFWLIGWFNLLRRSCRCWFFSSCRHKFTDSFVSESTNLIAGVLYNSLFLQARASKGGSMFTAARSLSVLQVLIWIRSTYHRLHIAFVEEM